MEIGLGAAEFSVRADVIRPYIPGNQIIGLRFHFLQPQQILKSEGRRGWAILSEFQHRGFAAAVSKG